MGTKSFGEKLPSRSVADIKLFLIIHGDNYLHCREKLHFLFFWTVQKKLVSLDQHRRVERLFVEGGFSKWHKDIAKLSLHEKSPIHRDAIQTLAGLQQMLISLNSFWYSSKRTACWIRPIIYPENKNR